MSEIAIVNIGRIVSGDIAIGVIEQADTIVIRDGRIAEIGTEGDVDIQEIARRVDVNGMTVTPGLIDSHVHPAIGDWTPRHGAIGYIANATEGGVTTMISQGEFHVQGRPNDPAGIKALAILAKKTFDRFTPGGVRVYG